MNQLLDFLKDWAAPIGVLVGGPWVLFRWWREERLRQRRDIPALFGVVHAAVIPLDAQRALLSVETNWRNSSHYPIYVDPKATRFDLFSMPSDIPLGSLKPKHDLGEPIAQLAPLADMSDFVFEPATESQLRAYFVVKRDAVYLVRSKVYRDPRTRGDKVFAWTRETIIDARLQSEPRTSPASAVEQAVAADGALRRR